MWCTNGRIVMVTLLCVCIRLGSNRTALLELYSLTGTWQKYKCTIWFIWLIFLEVQNPLTFSVCVLTFFRMCVCVCFVNACDWVNVQPILRPIFHATIKWDWMPFSSFLWLSFSFSVLNVCHLVCSVQLLTHCQRDSCFHLRRLLMSVFFVFFILLFICCRIVDSLFTVGSYIKCSFGFSIDLVTEIGREWVSERERNKNRRIYWEENYNIYVALHKWTREKWRDRVMRVRLTVY